VNRQEVLYGFDLDDYSVFNQKIDDVALGELDTLVLDRQEDLTFMPDIPELQLTA
jgi:hypothetical protein